MNKLNNWLTLLANVGVIAGILFLAYEIRQNTTSLHAAATQASTEVARENIMTLVNDPSLIDLKNKEPGELGVLPDEEWLVWQRIICTNMNTDFGITDADVRHHSSVKMTSHLC